LVKNGADSVPDGSAPYRANRKQSKVGKKIHALHAKPKTDKGKAKGPKESLTAKNLCHLLSSEKGRFSLSVAIRV